MKVIIKETDGHKDDDENDGNVTCVREEINLYVIFFRRYDCLFHIKLIIKAHINNEIVSKQIIK